MNTSNIIWGIRGSDLVGFVLVRYKVDFIGVLECRCRDQFWVIKGIIGFKVGGIDALCRPIFHLHEKVVFLNTM